MKKNTVFNLSVVVILFISGLICAPHSCDWGNGNYAIIGIFCCIISIFFTLIFSDKTGGKKILSAISSIITITVSWVFFFFVMDFRIMCRLF